LPSALVTGAAQGIGLAVAKRLAAEGLNVLMVDRNTGTLEQAAAEVGENARLFTVDLSNLEALPSWARTLDPKHGPVEVLVNCAGICPTENTMNSSVETWRKVFDVNVFALFSLCQTFGAIMSDRGRGSIINMASNSGFVPKLEQAAYGASKAAVISLTRSLASTLGPQGVRVNAVAPGVIDTPLTQSIAEQRSAIRGVTPQETLAPILGGLPLRRMGLAHEVAEVVAFLASDQSAFVTGQTYLVDGGQLMR
jgi:NAD(P)-dependent dehydrogenase (short-subunit alcohol dehydrogenase family)